MEESLNIKDMTEFQQELYALTTKYMRRDQPSSLYMCCGVMLKTVVQMYISVISEETIEKILLEAVKSIPMLKENMDKSFAETTYH